MKEIRIPYKPRKLKLLFAIFYFGVATAIIGNDAIKNSQGVINSKASFIFLWSLAAASSSFMMVGIALLYKSFFSFREVVITDDAITAPRSGLSNKYVTVSFSNEAVFYMRVVMCTKFLIIQDSAGNILSIPNNMLPNKVAFEKLIVYLQDKITSL